MDHKLPRPRPFLLLCIAVVNGLATKKSPTKKTASTLKGFGSAPPTFADIVSGFRTRLPDNAGLLPCSCGSLVEDDSVATSGRRLYKDCCEPIHLGLKTCARPLDVLRSRYSAFSFRLISHVIATTHPTCRDYQDDTIAWARSLNRNGMFDSFDFVALEHGDELVDGDQAWIEFTVRLRAKDQADSNRLSGKESEVMEKSLFLRDDQGVWSYASGDVRTAVTGSSILN